MWDMPTMLGSRSAIDHQDGWQEECWFRLEMAMQDHTNKFAEQMKMHTGAMTTSHKAIELLLKNKLSDVDIAIKDLRGVTDRAMGIAVHAALAKQESKLESVFERLFQRLQEIQELQDKTVAQMHSNEDNAKLAKDPLESKSIACVHANSMDVGVQIALPITPRERKFTSPQENDHTEKLVLPVAPREREPKNSQQHGCPESRASSKAVPKQLEFLPADASGSVDMTGPTPFDSRRPRSVVRTRSRGGSAKELHNRQLKSIQKILQHKSSHKEIKDALREFAKARFAHFVCVGFTSVSQSAVFNIFSATVTLAFATLIGYEADQGLRSAYNNADASEWIGFVVNCFNVWFIVEVVLRIVGDRVEFIIGTEWRWNIFDFFLMLLSVMDLVVQFGSVGFMRLLRSFKVVRAVRVVRILRLFQELRLLAASMLTSMGSLFWSLCFLFLVTYIFAVGLLQGAEGYIRKHHTGSTSFVETDVTAKGLKAHFPKLSTAMYTMLGCITGGVDWMDAGSAMWGVGKSYGLGFLAFVLVSVLGILNVITSVFVERASNMKRVDRDFAITEEIRVMEQDIRDTIGLFRELDVNGQGKFEMAEFQEYLRDDYIIAHFATIGVDVTDPELVQSLFDCHNTGFVTAEAFVINCMNLRGQSKQSSTMSIVLEVRKLHSKVEQLESLMRSITGSSSPTVHGSSMESSSSRVLERLESLVS